MLRLSRTEILLFCPFGEFLNQIGFLKLLVNREGGENVFEVVEIDEYEVHESEEEFESRIVRMSVSAIGNVEFFETESGNNNNSVVVVVGFLLVCTVNCVHWYRIEINIGKPNIVYLGSKEFGGTVIYACWNPHLPEECLVLLDNGDMFLFELGDLLKVSSFPVMLEGKRVSVSWESEDLDCVDSEMIKESKWLSVGFSWHPRIFVVACSSAVFMVDWRFEESNVSVLASIGTLHLNCTTQNSQFIAFCNAGNDGFYFTVATEENLFLIDIRKPMMPVLQWFHGLDKPRYMEVFSLSKLRSAVNDDQYKWASDSGFAILLGSPLDSKFKIFCYGPPLLAPENSVATKVSKFGNSCYAWELPSEVSLLGRRCNSGDCLLKQDFGNAALPEWKTERLLGFCIFDYDGSDSLPEPDGLRGFTLIRLLSSGKLESQKYLSSFDFVNHKSEETRDNSVKAEDFFVDLFIDQKYKFPKRFRYLHLDSLLGFMTGNLPKVLMSKMMKICGVSDEKTPYTQDSYEHICDILKAAGVDSVGFCPTIENVLNNVSWPMNLHEITSSRMWGGIKVDFLHLAFCIYSELVGVLVEHRKISMEALEIPMLPQLPPFFAKTPTSRSHRWSWKLQLGDVLVGPVLPLPYLRAFQKVKKDKSSMCIEEDGNDEAEMSCECNKVMIAASEMAISGSPSELNDSVAISLGNDVEDRWVDSDVLKPVFLHRPSVSLEKNRGIVATSLKNHIYEDEKFDTFISKTRVKEKSSSPLKEPFGLDIFDDMCPMELNFDYPEVNFGVKESKGYNLLKGQFSRWQSGNKQYQDFCKSLKIQKRAS